MGTIATSLLRIKNMQQISLLTLSSLASICLFCACWALLLDGALSRQVTVLLDLLRDVLKEEVMWNLDQNQMRLVDTVTTVVKVLAVASSSFSCFNLLALASITIEHRPAHWLILPWPLLLERCRIGRCLAYVSGGTSCRTLKQTESSWSAGQWISSSSKLHCANLSFVRICCKIYH